MKVDFTTPPRIGHTPGVLDGRRYIVGWRKRKAEYPQGRIEDQDELAGWFDADRRIMAGDDIGWPEKNNLGEILA